MAFAFKELADEVVGTVAPVERDVCLIELQALAVDAEGCGRRSDGRKSASGSWRELAILEGVHLVVDVLPDSILTGDDARGVRAPGAQADLTPDATQQVGVLESVLLAQRGRVFVCRRSSLFAVLLSITQLERLLPLRTSATEVRESGQKQVKQVRGSGVRRPGVMNLRFPTGLPHEAQSSTPFDAGLVAGSRRCPGGWIE